MRFAKHVRHREKIGYNVECVKVTSSFEKYNTSLDKSEFCILLYKPSIFSKHSCIVPKERHKLVDLIV